MDNITSEAFRILEGAGYRLPNADPSSMELVFESKNIIGFLVAFESADALLKNWDACQSSFLQRHGMHIRRSGEKAWNVYSIFLTAVETGDRTNNMVAVIEEDFSGTRKIARTGIRSISALINALLPVLPLQYRIALEYEKPEIQLRDRIDLPERATDVLLSKGSPAELVRILWEEQ